MRRFTRSEVLELLHIEEPFLESLEREEIVALDESEGYSEIMLERIRVAVELVEELEVNLAGVAVILRMREEMIDFRVRVCGVLEVIQTPQRPR